MLQSQDHLSAAFIRLVSHFQHISPIRLSLSNEGIHEESAIEGLRESDVVTHMDVVLLECSMATV